MRYDLWNNWAFGCAFVLGLLSIGCRQGSQPNDAQPTANTTKPVAATDQDPAAQDEPAADQSASGTDEPAPTVPVEPADTQSPAALAVGAPAPSLAIGQWVKGTAVNDFASDRVYVVEFWATWCPPCRASMPHLSQLQQQHGDRVTFIGISDENEATVKAFMDGVQDEESGKTWNEVVAYTIALDAEERTSNAYMRAAGQNGIPTAFVVGKDGHVEWIGHPMSIDDPLNKILAGDWDREQARPEFLAQRAAESNQ
jgi:thiol-disulfide isomerase/thioredoxin